MNFDIQLIKNFYLPQNILDFLHSGIEPFDFWLAIHFGVGALFALLPLKFKGSQLFIILVLYELFENFYLAPMNLSILETPINMGLDIFVGMAGFIVVRWLRWRGVITNVKE